MTQLTQQQLEIVKQDHPEWFILEDGKWYAHVSNGFPLIFKTGDKRGYGFFGEPNKFHWCEESNTWSFEQEPESWREATEDEVKHALVEEAKRRGFKHGLSCYWNEENITHRNLQGDFVYRTNNYLCIGDKVIYQDGVWAEITISNIHDDIQTLKDKYPDYNLTIIAEKKN